MEEKLPYLQDTEIERLKMCVSNIQDKMKAIEMESEKERPYKHYLKEKADSVYYDIKVILNMLD